MDEEKGEPLTPLHAVLKYKELANSPSNHSEMIKDKTMINFLAYVLDSADEEVLKASVDTLLLLTESRWGLEGIKSTFGVAEALKALEERKNLEDPSVREKTSKLLERIKNGETGRNDKKSVKKVPSTAAKKRKVLMLHINGLHFETRKELEDILTRKMKGIHSLVVDVEHQKCTVTAYENVDPKAIASVISENTDMEAQLISKNKRNQEILVPLIESDKTLDLDRELPPYLDEMDSPVKEKAVRSAKDIRITASEWFCTAAGFLQRTFYW